MESSSSSYPTTYSNSIPVSSSNEGMFSGKNGIIAFLLLLVIFLFLGINLLSLSGQLLKHVAEIMGPVVLKVASILGYSTGQLIGTTADVVSDGAKLGVDIAEGTAHSVGDLLKNSSKGGMDEQDRLNLEKALTPARCPTQPAPVQATDVIQTSISSKKSSWCLIGEDNGKRGCIEIGEHDKCLSGQTFASREQCVKP